MKYGRICWRIEFFVPVLMILFFSTVINAATIISLQDTSGNSFKRVKKSDTVCVQVKIDVDTIRAQGVAFYITFNDTFFSVVDQGTDTLIHPFSFKDGVFGTGYTENDTHGDPGNTIPGFQLNGSILKSTGYFTGKGLVARFYLVAKADVESSLVTIDYDLGNHRDTRLHKKETGSSEPFWIREPLRLSVGIRTGIEETINKEILDQYYLSQNFPNPFNPTTIIRFQTLQVGNISIKIYNILGQEIKTVVSDRLSAGSHEVQWDGTDNFGNKVSSGIYIYRMETGTGYVKTRKLVFLK